MKPYDLPPYPYDRLDALRALAAERHGSAIDLSIGTPADDPPQAVVDALSASGRERRYPPSIGSPEFRGAVVRWFDRQCGVQLDPADVGATIGLKEFVAGLPHLLRLRDPERDTVLFPSISYPSYAMGADLAHGRSVAVPVDADFRLRLDAIDPADAARASCLWINSPGNPAGAIEDLGAAAEWGRAHGVPVFSDECYIEFAWNGRGRTILEHGVDGVMAVHSLSKRSNLAGVRIGYYAGDPELVLWLQEIRKHTGAMAPWPSQHAAIVALDDQEHVDQQRKDYERRMRSLIDVLDAVGVRAAMPEGGFYLWTPAPEGGWALAERLATELGLICSPGEFYGAAGADYVRLAVVCQDDAIATLAERAAS